MPADRKEGVPRGKRFITTTIEVEGREETRVVELPDFEPSPWEAGAPLTVVGKAVPRRDAPEKVTGRATYTADLQRPGMLFAVMVRAAIARGRVVSIDAIRARALPGVVDVVSSDDLTSLSRRPRAGGVALFDRAIAYAGQPVAAVCAESLAAAHRAAAAVTVEYDVATPVTTVEQALAPNAARVRESGNVSPESPSVAARGDVARGLREAEVTITREYRTPAALHSALEPHGAVAEWDGDRLTLWEGTQGIFAVRDGVAAAFGLPRSSVRVLMEYMGGGFGAKNGAGAHSYVAALLARRTRRPVRCVLDRHGEQVDTGHRTAMRMRITLGAMRDGRLTAINAESEVEMGVAGWEASPTKILHELYACPNVRTSDTFVYVNTGAMAAFRAPGHAEGAFAQERAMDVLARELGLDPLDLRLRNYAERDEEKRRPYSGGSLRRCYDEGAARFGWRERQSAREKGTERNTAVTEESGTGAIVDSGGSPDDKNSNLRPPASGLKRGFGMAAQIWPTGGGPPAYATVRLNPDGSVDVLAGTQDLGTGTRTVLAQVAAEALGARIEDVRLVLGDTERTPYTGNSWGSITVASVAPAVRMAAEEARARLIEAAAEILDCSPDELVVRNGMIDKRDCTQHISIAEVTKKLGQVTITGQGSRGPNPRDTAIVTFGAHFVEVEVDEETGIVCVVRIVAAHDAGRVINPVLARSQLEGGILQGLGFALFEEKVIDERSGIPLNTGLHDYKIPTLADVPAIDAFCVAAADPVANHVGARGLAEPPIIPVAPAIANAVADALGVEVDEIPLTPWRVLAALDRRDAV